MWRIVLLVACGSARSGTQTKPGISEEEEMIATASRGADAPESTFAALDVGADYKTFRRVTEAPFLSAAHGDRWVHVYVSPDAANAYVGGTDVPVGTTVVKVSWMNDEGKPSTTAGPIYVMQKRAAGWYYAIHWAHPVGKLAARGPIYWRGSSPRVKFCYESCHDNYDNSLGGLTPSSLLPR